MNIPIRNPLRVLTVFMLAVFCHSPAMGLSAAPPKDSGQLALTPVASDTLHKPVFLTHARDASGRMFVVEQDGKILILEKDRLLPDPFLDISSLLATGGERGLLGLAFHPDYRENGRFFINYTRRQDGATVIAEYRVSSNPQRSEVDGDILLVIPQPYGNHNGGMVAFGPDRMLYIGTGDGGAGGDPENRGQNPKELLGKILRIDIDQGPPYGTPSDNPFAEKGGAAEIFATGFRNPWRFSFDRKTGDLWVGDVGQNAWEEIDLVRIGENHGWRFMEGSHCFNPENGCQSMGDLTPPVLDYSHDNGRCSVTGGYVYRGNLMPDLHGTYLFGDFCSGEIFGYRNGKYRVLLDTSLHISSFGEDANGELYVLGHEGSVHRLSPGPMLTGLQQ